MEKLTLDEAQDSFRNDGTLLTAQAYLDTVLDYWVDDMIGDETLGAAKVELRDWCEATGERLADPRTNSEWAMD